MDHDSPKAEYTAPAETAAPSVLLARGKSLLEKAATRNNRIQERVRLLSERAEHLTSEIGHAKGRLSLSDEVQLQLETLQHRAHERSVGAFERLLTAILGDVLPGEGEVRFELALKNNSTWLDVLLSKDGHLEDVLEGNGGAVANVLSTGLRFATLSRTQNRRLLVLDEPDCWIKPDRVPAFVNVISKVSEASGFQTFLISHHSTDLFNDTVNLIELGKDEEGKVVVRSEFASTADWANDEQPGIRAIELHNVRTHEQTTLRFRPGATAIIGDNNLGKSTAILSSLKAVAYGESSDEIIRHGCDEARIVIHLEMGKRLVWSRKLKRSPVVMYQLFGPDSEQPLAEGRPGKRNEAPDWVTAELGINRVDDLNVQLRSQKSPVFLLDDTASRRAQVLSIGRESGYLQRLMAEYDAQKSEDRTTVKRGEAELSKLLPLMDKAKPMAQKAIELGEALDFEATDAQALIDQLRTLALSLSELDAADARLAAASALKQRLEAHLSLPTARDPHECGQLVRTLSAIPDLDAQRKKLPAPVLLPAPQNPQDCLKLVQALSTVPDLALCRKSLPGMPTKPEETHAKLQDLLQHGKQLAQALRSTALRSTLTGAKTPPDAVTTPWAMGETLNHLTEAQKKLKELETEAASIKKLKDELTTAENEIRAATGGVCPLCNATLPSDGLRHDHAH